MGQFDIQPRREMWFYAEHGDAERWSGPYSAEAEAIHEGCPGTDYVGFYTCMGVTVGQKFSDYCAFGDLVSVAEDEFADSDLAGEEYDGYFFEGITDAQERDLAARLAKTVDEWQAENKLVFMPNIFSEILRTKRHTSAEILARKEAQTGGV